MTPQTLHVYICIHTNKHTAYIDTHKHMIYPHPKPWNLILKPGCWEDARVPVCACMCRTTISRNVGVSDLFVFFFVQINKKRRSFRLFFLICFFLQINKKRQTCFIFLFYFLQNNKKRPSFRLTARSMLPRSADVCLCKRMCMSFLCGYVFWRSIFFQTDCDVMWCEAFCKSFSSINGLFSGGLSM